MYRNTCKWCNDEIETINQQKFASHVAHCIKNPNHKRENKNKGKKLVERIELKKECLKCKNSFKVISTESEIRRNKVRNYCSRKCGNSRIRSVEDKLKISIGVKKPPIFIINNRKSIDRSKLELINCEENKKSISKSSMRLYVLTCLYCDMEFESKIQKKLRKYCSLECQITHRKILKTPKSLIEFTCLYCNEIGYDKKNNKKRKYHNECYKKCSGGIREGSSRGIKGNYKGYKCDSSYELVYIIYCLDNNMSIERNSESFNYEFGGKIRKFYPDFVVNGEYVEIKNYKSDITNAKLKYFPHNITILYKEEIQFYIKYVIEKYGKNYLELYE